MSPSRILHTLEIVVIDIGDSPLAPHQSIRDRKHYYRNAGHSEPAPHFYIELLRQWLTNPVLKFSLTKFELLATRKINEEIFLDVRLHFWIENTGRVAAYKWALFIKGLHNLPDNRGDNYHVGGQNYPIKSLGIAVSELMTPYCRGWFG